MSLDAQANRCFVCGPGNARGLQVQFRIEDGVCRAECQPGPEHIGYEGVTHGGIIFSLLDDVMANWIWLHGEKCFTAKAEIRYRAALPAETPVRLEGRQLQRKGRLAQMEGRLWRDDTGELIAEATASFMIEPATVPGSQPGGS
jgi:acyl-coenzyme A thioesterase PaaI-like protein